MDEIGLRRTAAHEACHACLAHHYGWPVLSLRATAGHDGCTQMVLPFTLGELQKRYRFAPVKTRQDLTAILAVLNAPSVIQSEPVSGGDERDLRCWEYFYERTRHAYGDPPFASLVTEARADIRAWLTVEAHQKQLMRVAQALAAHRFLNGEAFRRLVRTRQPTRPPAPVVPALRQTSSIEPRRKEDWEKHTIKPMSKEQYEQIFGAWHLSSRGLVCTRPPRPRARTSSCSAGRLTYPACGQR